MNDKPQSGRQKRSGNGPRKASVEPPSAAARRAAPPNFREGYDHLLVNGSINEVLYGLVVKEVLDHQEHDKIVFCLTTFGGQANAAYRIGRFLQSMYKELVAYVPSICKSAGTLVVTAAHRVVMPVTGEIGPLDVQLTPRDELLGSRSGLTTGSALHGLQDYASDLFHHFVFDITRRSEGTISYKMASDIAMRATVGCMSPIYDKINPDALGQDLRDLNVATEYCRRLSRRSNNLKPDAIRKLVHDYPSHDFVIDFDDARQIFTNLTRTSSGLRDVYNAKGRDVVVPRTRDSLVDMISKPPPPPQQAQQDETPPVAENENEQTNESPPEVGKQE